MKSFVPKTLILILLGLVSLVASAQRTTAPARRSPAQLRAALVNAVGTVRAESLSPVVEHDAISVLSSAQGGFAVVNHSTHFPAVLAYGDQPFDSANPSPEFLYLMELYEEAIEAAETAANAGALSDAAGDAPQSDEAWTTIAPMLTTKWGQGSPYYNKCPLGADGKSRCITGCVATAMAQVLNYYELPKHMTGRKTYGYLDDKQQRRELSFNYGETTFDWANMHDTYSVSNSAQKDAVATLMLACGVATGMRYTPSESGANTWVGDDGINCFMDGIRADHYAFSTDRVLQELKAGHPVIYSGATSSGGAHCFVIDGCRSDGYFHCNLGWNGSSDGYYLPTDMKGYAARAQAIECVYPSDYVPTYTPIAELQGKYATASTEAATSVEVGQWYVLWNSGRSGSPMSNGVGNEITNTSIIPSGTSTSLCAPQLIRLQKPSLGSGYYIQTGLGDYFGNFPQYYSGRATKDGNTSFTISTIQQGYFCIRGSNAVYLDTNGPGGTVVGWNTMPPTDIYSNSSWQIFPVTLSDTDPTAGLGIGAGARFDNDKFYTLKNTGYSQGLLVALTENDANPTLRGVTQNHSSGIYKGAAYHDAVDEYNRGTYWQIITENGKQYLKNYGTGKYLTNGGDKTCYVFTDQKTPINIVLMDDGSYRFNAGSQAESFLCAATQLANPAAFWTYDDAGSIWQVEETEVKRPYTPVTGVVLNGQSASLFAGSSLQLEATVSPEFATNPELSWTSSNAEVATVSDGGLVRALKAGDALITATSIDNPSCQAVFSLKVYGATAKQMMSEFADGDVYLIRNVGGAGSRYSQGYLVATNPVATDDSGHQYPVLRGVEIEHAQGCIDSDYKSALDYTSPYSYWQIFTDGSDRYLYNIGVGKFLTNQGNRSCYVFTDEPTPINVTFASNGVFRFNVGTDSQSYLCAATHLRNPAAYWTATDPGSYWSVTAIEGLDDSTLQAVGFFDIVGKTIGDLTQIISRLPQGEATLDDVEKTKRYILHQKKQ